MIFGEALALFGLIMSLVIGGISIDESVCYYWDFILKQIIITHIIQLICLFPSLI